MKCFDICFFQIVTLADTFGGALEQGHNSLLDDNVHLLCRLHFKELYPAFFTHFERDEVVTTLNDANRFSTPLVVSVFRYANQVASRR